MKTKAKKRAQLLATLFDIPALFGEALVVIEIQNNLVLHEEELDQENWKEIGLKKIDRLQDQLIRQIERIRNRFSTLKT
jgi:hypothetical protein